MKSLFPAATCSSKSLCDSSIIQIERKWKIEKAMKMLTFSQEREKITTLYWFCFIYFDLILK